MMHISMILKLHVSMMRYILVTNQRTNKAILGVGCIHDTCIKDACIQGARIHYAYIPKKSHHRYMHHTYMQLQDHRYVHHTHMHHSQGSRNIDKCIIHASGSCIRILYMYKCIISMCIMVTCIRIENICIVHTYIHQGQESYIHAYAHGYMHHGNIHHGYMHHRYM